MDPVHEAVMGKWRAILRGLDTSTMRKLNRNPRGGWHVKEVEWCCSMNSWDETKASCSAPQRTCTTVDGISATNSDSLKQP